MARFGRARAFPPIIKRFLFGAAASISFQDANGNAISNLPSNHGSGTITVEAIASGFSFTNPATWTVSGVTGWSLSSSTFVSGSKYTLVLGCPAAATPPAGSTGTLTLSDTTDSVSGTLTVTTPTISISPVNGQPNTTPTLTLTGNVQLWTDETASTLFSVSGGTGSSVASTSVSTNTSATTVLTDGSAAALETVKDTSTGATAVFRVIGLLHFAAAGSDTTGDGTTGNPLQTIGEANTLEATASAGDGYAFNGGDTFSGNLAITVTGTQTARRLITSYGSGQATINPGTAKGVFVYTPGSPVEFVTVSNLTINTNTATATSFTSTAINIAPHQGRDMTAFSWGVLFYNDATCANPGAATPARSCWIDNCTVIGTVFGIGFQTPNYISSSTLDLCGYVDWRITNCTVHDVILVGVWCLGGNAHKNGWSQEQLATAAIKTTLLGGYIGDTNVYNIAGTNASASAIWCYNATGLTIERCQCSNISTADTYPNTLGWGSASMQIEYSDTVVFRWCEASTNKSVSPDAEAFDPDIGVTHCTIEYCYAHDNNGSGFITFDNSGTNVLRYSTSRNDCRTNTLDAISWCGLCHNCTVYLGSGFPAGAAVAGECTPGVGASVATKFIDCIFQTTSGTKIIDYNSGVGLITVIGCVYYWGGGTQNFDGTITTLSAWQSASPINQEKYLGILYGVVGDPKLSAPTTAGNFSPASALYTMTYFDLLGGSAALNAGIPLELLGYNSGPSDFHGNPSRTAAAALASATVNSGMVQKNYTAPGGSGGAFIIGPGIVRGLA